jgi:hypothetical protein
MAAGPHTPAGSPEPLQALRPEALARLHRVRIEQGDVLDGIRIRPFAFTMQRTSPGVPSGHEDWSRGTMDAYAPVATAPVPIGVPSV